MLKVFVDSDVIISSLISSTGAAHFLLHQTTDLELFISSVSKRELDEVVARLSLENKKLTELIDKRITKINLKEEISEIKSKYEDYVLDINDAHIVAGAKASSAQFLVSYNTKHFKADKLKEDFKIILITPATILQYLRSL